MDGDEQNDPPSIPPKNHVIHLSFPPSPPLPPWPGDQIFSFSHTRD